MAASDHPARTWRFAVAGAALLMIAGGVLFTLALQRNRTVQSGGAVPVTIGARSCQPNALKVPAGKTVFEITNASERTVEWEIVEGVMVVAERENILPGFKQTLTAQLKPGRYEMTCGLLTNPRGAIEAVAVAGDTGPKTVDDKAFLGALSEYQVYLRLQARALAKSTQDLADAIRAGDLARAKAVYLDARLSYAKLANIMLRFSDAEAQMNPSADFLEKREADPAFTGFHRLEYGLFAKSSAEGLQPMADKLARDAATLGDRIRDIQFAPADLAGNAAKLAARMAERQVPRGENLYALSDLAEFEAELAGIAKIVSLLKPMLAVAAGDKGADLEARLAAAQGALAALSGSGGYPPYDKVDAAGRSVLADRSGALSQALANANQTLGLE